MTSVSAWLMWVNLRWEETLWNQGQITQDVELLPIALILSTHTSCFLFRQT